MCVVGLCDVYHIAAARASVCGCFFFSIKFVDLDYFVADGVILKINFSKRSRRQNNFDYNVVYLYKRRDFDCDIFRAPRNGSNKFTFNVMLRDIHDSVRFFYSKLRRCSETVNDFFFFFISSLYILQW